MHSRIVARTAATAAALGIGATLVFTTPAVAAPEPTPADAALIGLTEQTADDPEASAGVAALRSYHRVVTAREISDIGVFAPFVYAAPTFGCGSNGLITTTFAAATANGPSANVRAVPRESTGTLTFHASPGHSGIPQHSGLVVAWLNINNGRSGITPLDDLTEFDTPLLSRTVDSGPGTVLASMWGTVGYPGSLCVMTPTVGLFPVADVPPAPQPAPSTPGDPGDPKASPAPPAPRPSGEPTPEPQTPPAGEPGGEQPATPAPRPEDQPAPAAPR